MRFLTVVPNLTIDRRPCGAHAPPATAHVPHRRRPRVAHAALAWLTVASV